MTIQQYIENISNRYKLGNSTEHTFRGDLQQLIESIVPAIRATNEPKRQKCGAPDFILTKKDIPIGFIETKDIGDDDLLGTKKTGNKEQFDRYRASLNNIIFTDYLNFVFYRDGAFVTSIEIAKVQNDKIVPAPENFDVLNNYIKEFCSHIGQTISSPKKLAEMMAGKARLLADIIEKAIVTDENSDENSTLKDQMTAFKQILIHDITPKAFADVYAQTIAYGMFAARYHDTSISNFSRQEAAELIPKSNPFLRKLFGYIAGPDLDDRIKWIVDSLVDIFLACNVKDILGSYGKATKMEDPIIHFYETFLSEYDPKLRKARGVWYTPQPVVNFIVRAVDDILKTEFGLPQGLADNSKTKIKINQQGKMIEQEVHKVQILDPATGTGTFLAETVKHIHKNFEGQQGIWSNYVETHLLPRLNGFELLMASYAMAHLKMDLLLTDTGYNTFPSSGGVPEGRGGSSQRFRIYLTNSLEEHHPETGTLFANWLSNEAREANEIKRDTPVMVIMGNPPYSGESANKGEWIMNLMEDYKKEPGGKEKLKERNPKWINDDYVKFIRYGQYFIEKNGSGVLAFINPHGFLDNPTFRGMRWNLLKTYDKIYTIDLHGNAKKKETALDGSADENVFDIQQGVSINLFVKTGKKKSNELGKLFHFDLFGKRESKYDYLNDNSLKSVSYKEIPNKSPMYFMAQKDFEVENIYGEGFKINDLFPVNSVGIVTARDGFTIHDNKKDLINTIEEFLSLEDEAARLRFNLGDDVRDWQVNFAKKDLQNNYPSNGSFCKITYRPFDEKWTYYTGKSKGFHCYPRTEVMQHFINGDNIGIVFEKIMMNKTNDYRDVFITKTVFDAHSIGSASYSFPLYLYPENTGQIEIGQSTERTPNLNTEIVNTIAEGLGLSFTPEQNSPPLEGYAKRGVVNDTQLIEATDTSVEILTHINGVPIKRNFVEDLPYNIALEPKAKELRKAGILSEVLFWKQVNKGKFYKIDFDRQRVIGNYIVDFYVKALGLVVEIDGSSHDDKIEYDAERQTYLESLNLKVYRIGDLAVKKNIGAVLEGLEDFIVENYGILNSTSAKEHSVPPSIEEESNTFAPIDILDYIYAVLHSPAYREKYKEFLKIDFPRVPYPKDKNTFWQLIKLGGELRRIHLLESPVVEKYITQYPLDGNNEVTKIKYENGKVFINETQHFAGIPEIAWNFFIGGYQPAQKWLKDRKGRTLEFNDILHYQKIIVALSETARLMQEIDKIEIE